MDMDNYLLVIGIECNTVDGTFVWKGNVKEDKVEDLVVEYLRTQIGKRADNTDPPSLDLYHVTICIDLSDDSFLCDYDCVNKGLRDGILSTFVQLFSTGKVVYSDGEFWTSRRHAFNKYCTCSGWNKDEAIRIMGSLRNKDGSPFTIDDYEFCHSCGSELKILEES